MSIQEATDTHYREAYWLDNFLHENHPQIDPDLQTIASKYGFSLQGHIYADEGNEKLRPHQIAGKYDLAILETRILIPI